MLQRSMQAHTKVFFLGSVMNKEQTGRLQKLLRMEKYGRILLDLK